MHITFKINYNTAFGEEIMLNINLKREDGETDNSRYTMTTVDGKNWQFKLELKPEDRQAVMEYYYSAETEGAEKRREWTAVKHRLELNALKGEAYTVYDHWNDIPEDSYLYSSAFTECINKRKSSNPKKKNFDRTIRIIVRAPQLRSMERLALVGEGKALGNWNPSNALCMAEHNTNEWMIDIDATEIESRHLEFKFVALRDNDNDEPMWETGDNRTIELPELKSGDVIIYPLDQAFFPLYDVRIAGTLVPVFALRSATGFGVGDFGDLKMMIDYVASTRQRILQVLPINDTTMTHTWTDSYPYSCISIFALHPQYVDIRQLPPLKDKNEAARFEEIRQQLNALPQIDYERVNDAKTEYMKLLFEQEGKKIMATQEYRSFFSDNEMWLVPYAQYCFLRDKHATADFSKWEGHTEWNEADRKMLSTPRNKAYKEVACYYFVQFILHRQMSEAHDYARSKGVILKGDIPIGVNRNGCDVWTEPKYFNLNGQAGAPPDGFSVNGQNWGFPTYNWDEMLKDGCQWWVRRFQNMSKYFDAYRIDHVLGFFRIWEIPIDSVHGLLGQFSPALGMSREEIEGYGLYFQEELFTKPFIADWVLERVFREHANEVRMKYLNHLHDDIYEMKPEFNTQRKVEAAFFGKYSEEDIWIRDGLYALISNVLFVRDNKDSEKFHPRISAQYDFMYEALCDTDKAAFNRLYNEYYYRRHNHFWYQEAKKKLPTLVEATRMLVCAEDLGMVPDSVAWLIRELRILSLEIQSMPKDSKVRFGHLSHNPYRSVCTISTHDMPTLRQWWDEDYERTQDYYNTVLHRGDGAPHPLPGWLAREIISRHLTSPSMLCVLSIQDWLAIDEDLRMQDANAERINIPANPKHYWRYRMHMSIEELMENADFSGKIAELIIQSGRK
jgi:4-alpha-glucanotransferase